MLALRIVFLGLVAVASLSCASVRTDNHVKFDYDEYRAKCMENVVAELFTTGNTAAPERMPQESTGGFPITLRSPMIHAIIVNFRDTPVRIKRSELHDSLFAIDRSGFMPSQYSVSPLMNDSEIVIPPHGTYTHTDSYPPIGETGVFWIRMNGIYSEPLRVRYKKK